MKSPWLVLLLALVALIAVACGGDSDDDSDADDDRDATTERSTNTPEPTTPGGNTPSQQATPSATATSSAPVPTPVPFVPFAERRADGVRQEDACGALTVVREYTVAGVRDSITVVGADGAALLELAPPDPLSNVGVDWCYNIGGGSEPELATFIYSGGAHCCIVQAIYSFEGGKAQEVFTYNGGNAGGLVPREIDGRPPIELLGLDDRLAYFADLSFAQSPFIPIVYAFRDGEWVEATRDHKGVIQQHRTQLATEIGASCTDEATAVDCQRAFALAMLADSAMLGDWETFRTSLSLQDGTWDWLLAKVTEVHNLVAEPKD